MNRSIFMRILPLLLTLACAAAIFMFSRQSGIDSAEVSDSFLRHALAFWRQIPVSQIPLSHVEKYGHLVRKLAHLFIYFLLGIFSYWSAFALLRKHRGLVAFSFCVLYAVSDELHQLTSDGRNGQLRDVLIDSAGAAAGILLICLVLHYFLCKKLEAEQKKYTA
ncbi:MAG: VanZ family protein [Ruminococcus sp.]|nr:VanZ family protein [Ruminococcus sp.]